MEIIAALIGVVGTLVGVFVGVKYTRQQNAEDSCNRILLAVNDALTELVFYREWVEAGLIKEYASTSNRIRALADELLIVCVGLPDQVTLTQTAHQLRWITAAIPTPYSTGNVATPMLEQLHRTHDKLFENWDDGVTRAVASIAHSVALQNGAPVGGVVQAPPPQVAHLRAKKLGLPPPDHSVQVRVVKGNARVHGSDETTGTE